MILRDTKALLRLGNSVFVNGRGRPEIMEDMRSRIARGGIKKERADAIELQTPTSFHDRDSVHLKQ